MAYTKSGLAVATLETHKQLIHSGCTTWGVNVRLKCLVWKFHQWLEDFMSSNAYGVLQLVKSYHVAENVETEKKSRKSRQERA